MRRTLPSMLLPEELYQKMLLARDKLDSKQLPSLTLTEFRRLCYDITTNHLLQGDFEISGKQIVLKDQKNK